ncbi:hypothetical protein NA57DRAFT_70661 [Rhizodiscina lignyota]|uniref:DUF7704 domain-containing protein n=1 Tax=Rhizodiscina lignyota TaxID=1504668 RepID=A0A9P4MEG9_9PEZI|nr:hypothetical protein NA57DRAFT_70661 [Rhizodiscina lignyota]
MALSALPTWPLLLFGVIEPVLLTWAYILCLKDPQAYYMQQHPNQSLFQGFPAQALSLSLQMGNVLLLLAAMAVICCFTNHSDISKKYLIAVAFADFGHIYAAYVALGDDYFWDVGKWNDMTWGNVGVSVFLNANRWLTVLGVFGAIGNRGRRGVKEN